MYPAPFASRPPGPRALLFQRGACMTCRRPLDPCAFKYGCDGARTVGSSTLQAVDKVKELDEEYKVLDKAKKLIDDAIEGGKKLLEGGD